MGELGKSVVDTLRWKKFPVLSDGFVCLVDVMGTDSSIVQAARVSYGEGTKHVSDDRTLIRYLMRHRHTTPFEMVEIKFLVRVPMDCWRQWIRHRTACLSGDTELSFDAPASVGRGKPGHFTRTVKEIFDLWNYGIKAVKDVSKKDHFLDRVDSGYKYTASQLGELVERDDVQIRQMVGRGVLEADRSAAPMLISGDAWHRYANMTKNVEVFVPIKDRVRSMNLRMMDEDTGGIGHTHITDIWESGVKIVYEVEFDNGKILRASADHLCLTDNGWIKLKTALDSGATFYSSGKKPRPVHSLSRLSEQELDNEEWRDVIGYEGRYKVSNLGRVMSLVRVGRTSNRIGGSRIKALTPSSDRLVVGLSVNGETRAFMVHHLVAEAFHGPRPEGRFACHADGNSYNNRAINIYYGTPQDNTEDRMAQGGDQSLTSVLVGVKSYKVIGEEMTYDIEVEGPYHNFFAGGVVVHNSVNEYSTRYSEAIDSMDKTSPEDWRAQSKSNKQGSSEDGLVWPALEMVVDPEYNSPGEYLSQVEARFHLQAREVYMERLGCGVAREQARKDLPLSTYTEAYWKIDLHNLFHFLSLRMDSHAQKEIRAYADVMGNEIVAKLLPIAWEAFVDYRLEGMHLTKLDITMVAALSGGRSFDESVNGLGYFTDWQDKSHCRERDECRSKMVRLGLM